jgi:glycosyltransferase involved in cell wall biosynthesis
MSTNGIPQRVLAVVPAWQEQEAIAATLANIAALLPSVDVLVVDDGSRDRTAEVARNAGVAVASLPFNVGVGGAMRAGFLYATRLGYDAVVQIDADGQHDPAEVASLLATLKVADVVVGSRFGGASTYRVRGPRRWAMNLLARSLSMLTGTRLTDVTSGFRATGPRAIALFARDYPAEYLGDTVESLVLAHRAGLVIAQVPVVMRPRQGGTPSHGPIKAFTFLLRAILVLLLAVVHGKSEAAAVGGSEQ